jgi:hypothetical protein
MATEKRLDLIERNALKDALRTKEGAKALGHSVHRLFCVDEIIDAQPTVDAVEVVHGRWETANDGTHFCPRCGCDAPYTWDDIDRNFINSADDVPDRPSNYCPNCGAKMDGEAV